MSDATAMKDYKESLKKSAENLLNNGFPGKIVELNGLIDSLDFQNRPLSDVHQDLNIPVPYTVRDEPRSKRRRMECPIMNTNFTLDGPKVYTLPNGPAPCNKFLVKLAQTVKPHIRQLANDSNILKMWISYLIPKIEDGNNFGVSIQSSTLTKIQAVEIKCEQLLDSITEYFVTRAKIVSKVAKYPHIEDYRKAVKDLDEQEYLSLWLALAEVRNRYCVLHDMVTKNYDKIMKPRSSNAFTLY